MRAGGDYSGAGGSSAEIVDAGKGESDRLHETTGKGTTITIWLIPPVSARLDTWAAEHGVT
jgi:hypothetical protein